MYKNFEKKSRNFINSEFLKNKKTHNLKLKEINIRNPNYN